MKFVGAKTVWCVAKPVGKAAQGEFISFSKQMMR
jgi:hypothetical protein